MGRYWSEGAKSQFCRTNKCRDLMCSIMSITNNTVLNTQNLLRDSISGALTTKKKKNDNYVMKQVC